MTVKISTIQNEAIKNAALKADKFGTENGILEVNEISVFQAQARRDNCDSSLMTDILEKVSSEEEVSLGEEIKSAPKTNTDEIITAESIKKEMKAQEEAKSKEGKELGNDFYTLIHKGGTSARKHGKANDKLAEVNKDNVMDFIKGYYDNKGGDAAIKNNGYFGTSSILKFMWHGHEGILEHADDECDDNKIELKNKINLATSLLKKAKEHGLDETSDAYDKLVSTLMKYGDFNEETCEVDDLDDSRKNLKHFNRQYWGSTVGGAAAGVAAGAAIGCLFGPVGAVIGGIAGGIAGLFGSRRKDSEVMDASIKKLYLEIRNKESK